MKKSFFNEYFIFSASEKRSILIVSISIIIGVLTSLLIKHIPKTRKEFSANQLSEIYELAAKLSETEKLEGHLDNSSGEKYRELFVFDPNTASKTDFEKLGFSDRQINTIENYLNAGGRFYHKQDFRKIYNIREEEYIIYEPYIQIENSDAFLKQDRPDKKTKLSIDEESTFDNYGDNLVNVELNSASTNELTLLKGIGEVYASRIIKFRELLGGFHKEEQLLEVYGINDTIFLQLQSQIKIDTSIIRPIDLNNASYKDLIKHPYLDEYHTKAILNYRKFRKKSISKENLLRDNIIPKEVYDKLSPYLNP